jgi:hypothetical protein
MIKAVIEQISGHGLPETSKAIKPPLMTTIPNLKNRVKTHLLLFRGWCFSFEGPWAPTGVVGQKTTGRTRREVC